MHKRHLLFLSIIAVTAVLCSACGQTKALPDEPYEAVDYSLYPAPKGAYVGDTMPFVTDKGELELYYLYETDHNGQAYHPIYKYATKDLLSYEDQGKALDFGLLSDPDPAIGTGSVLKGQDGLYHLFYTGHNDAGNDGKGKECIMHATSTDRKTWTKVPEDTFFAPKGYSTDDFRDPEVFWMDEDQCYWMLVAAREESLGGVVAKYTSKDLKTWELQEPLYAPMAQYMLECPDLFKLGDYWYLTYSWDCVTYYTVSDSPNGPFNAPSDNVLDGSGFVFYAAKTAELNDVRYLCGWIGRAGLTSDSGIYQWAGNMLNHQLVDHDGLLGVREPETFAQRFTQEKPFQAVKKEGKVKIGDGSISLAADKGALALADMGTRPATMMLECDVTLGEGGCAGFAFGGSESDETYTGLCLDVERNLLHYEGYEVSQAGMLDPQCSTVFDFSAGGTHHVKLVCENEIVVMYVDDLKALSSRIGHSIDGAHIGVFANGCNAEFSNITIKLPQEG